MLARRPRPNSPAWHEFFGHARIYPNHCVFNLDQHGCGLNASTWPRFTGNKTWEGGDDFVPHVFELQLRPELRIIGVFNAFRFQASPHGLAQLEYLIKTNGVNAVIFHPPHPNRYYQTQCCTSDAPVCDGCGQHSGVQRSQLERLFHQKLPALLTGSWGRRGALAERRRDRRLRLAAECVVVHRPVLHADGLRRAFVQRLVLDSARSEPQHSKRLRAARLPRARATAVDHPEAADRPRLPARPDPRAGDADGRVGPNSA